MMVHTDHGGQHRLDKAASKLMCQLGEFEPTDVNELLLPVGHRALPEQRIFEEHGGGEEEGLSGQSCCAPTRPKSHGWGVVGLGLQTRHHSKPFPDHFETVFRPFSDHFQTVFRPFPDSLHSQTTFRPFSDHFQTIFRPFSDHFQTSSLSVQKFLNSAHGSPRAPAATV